jgi:hypothetical protein
LFATTSLILLLLLLLLLLSLMLLLPLMLLRPLTEMLTENWSGSPVEMSKVQIVVTERNAT